MHLMSMCREHDAFAARPACACMHGIACFARIAPDRIQGCMHACLVQLPMGWRDNL